MCLELLFHWNERFGIISISGVTLTSNVGWIYDLEIEPPGMVFDKQHQA